jgi:mycoredoxin-dependent peroxiredoxin
MTVQIGHPAPGFTLRSQHGEQVSLAQFRGEKRVVVVFYPYAFSGVCTGELCDIRDQLSDLSDERTALVAISCDPMYSLRALAERDHLDFPLLSDFWPHGAVSTAYDVFDERLGCSRRATFIVDRGGVLRWTVQTQMREARNLDDYRKALADIG